jgi:hypothetical protein
VTFQDQDHLPSPTQCLRKFAKTRHAHFNNGYRYLDLAYMPGGAKGGIEIQGYGSHARDLDVRRFKDLCRQHCLLALDGWMFFPIAYLSITDDPNNVNS